MVLLDSQDWMAPEEIRALWNAIDRAGSDSVRVIFRTAGTESPLESEELAPLREIWLRDDERSDIGFAARPFRDLWRLSLLCASLIEALTLTL